MAATLKYELLAKGPKSSRSISHEVGVSPLHRHFLQSSTTMTLLAQWLLTQEFLYRPQTSVMHQLFERPEAAHQSIWEQAIVDIAPWFDRILEYRYANGSRSMVLQNPTTNARTVWTSLNENNQLHPLVKDVFRSEESPLTTPVRPRWVRVRGHADELVSNWPTFRSFWAATDDEGGIYFIPFGWSFNDALLNESLFLHSIIASGDEVYLGINDDKRVRIGFSRIQQPTS